MDGERGGERLLGAGEALPRLVSAVPRLAVEWLARTPHAKDRAVEGTMVFVDISGFTALSERLARRGKAGAEELTEVLDGIFARLLVRAWTLGGGLVKFGGDALLLLFTGPEHPSQGCAAAFDLREELARTGSLETSAGPVTLQMSIGVHSGLFDFFLVGRSHRELLLTGPAASRTVAAEGRAEAGQILVTDETAVRLEAEAVGPSEGGSRLLLARPPACTVVDHGVEDLDTLPLDSCVPLGLREHMSSVAVAPEHRIVTVAFLHFMGIDGLLAERGAGHVAGVLDELVGAVQDSIDPYEVCFLGSDIYGDGGKLILTAGAPASRGNDEERMLRALREVFDRDLPVPLRAGLNRGHVYAGEVGATMRRTYTVMGDAVNLAARLMQAAEPGAILVTETVLTRSRTKFAREALEPFSVKGKTKPVQAYRLGAVTGWKRNRSTSLPLIGRDSELADLEAALRDARAGRGQLAALLGPAGIGKSRLIDELRRQAGDLTRVIVRCEQYEASNPFWAMRWLLRRLLSIPFDASADDAGRILRAKVERIAPQLTRWLPLLAGTVDANVPETEAVRQLNPTYRQDRLAAATVELITALLRDQTLLVFEDAFWMDEASAMLLRRLCQSIEERPWLVIVSARSPLPELVPENVAVRTVELEPLAPADAIALADAITDRDPRPPHELRVLAQRSEGNPLFLLELLGSGTRGQTDALPETIEAAISARIDILRPDDRALLRCASVLGTGFTTSLAAEALRDAAPVVGDETAWQRLAEFLEPQGRDRLRFRQTLVRDVAYEGLPFRNRQAIHASVALRVEQAAADPNAQAEMLALHFLRAERYDKAWHYARAAGEHARSKAATVEAAGFYRQALDAALRADVVQPSEISEVAVTLGDLCELAGLYDEGARAYRTARRLRQGDEAVVADLLRKEGFLHERTGRYRHARMLYRSGLRRLDASAGCEDRAAARVKAGLQVVTAASLIVEGRYRAGVWWARRAAALSQACEVPEVLAHAYYLLDWAFTDLGDVEAIAEYRGRALPIYEQLGDFDGLAKTLNNLGANAYYEGDWAQALSFYNRSREALEKVGNVVEAATVTSNIAEVLLQQGHLQDAEGLFHEAMRVLRGAGHRIGEAWATCNLGIIASRSGATARAVSLLTEARQVFAAIGAETYALEALARLAEVHALAGDHRQARSLASRALTEAETRGGLPLLEAGLDRTLGYALLQVGDLEHAEESFAGSLAKAESSGASYEVALTLDALARLERLGGGNGSQPARRSQAILEQLGVVVVPEAPLTVSGDSLRPIEGRSDAVDDEADEVASGQNGTTPPWRS